MTETKPETAARRGRPGYDQHGILEVAVAAFNEFGYDATSVGVLAERLGLSKSAIYHHVASKDELLRLALDEALDGLEGVLLEPGARVDIVSCGDKPSHDGDSRGHGAVADYLDHHGFEAGSVWLDQRYDVAEQLQTYALEIGADLLAAGAFAHSRLRELVFGGVTAGLINQTRIPVLLSR